MLDAQKARTAADHTTQPIQKLYMENTLLRVSGALFCHDPKRASMRRQEIVLNRGAAEKNIIVRPDPRLGQPGPLAHKVFVALLKKHSDYGRPIRGEVHFTRKEIDRLIGRKDWGGSGPAETINYPAITGWRGFPKTAQRNGRGGFGA